VHAFDERVLRRHDTVDNRGVVLQLRGQPACLELGEEAELANLSQSHREWPPHRGRPG
jgi:hypothetical protein